MSTKGRMLERLRVIMAGRAAEEVCTLLPSTDVRPAFAHTLPPFLGVACHARCLFLQVMLVLLLSLLFPC